MIKLEIVPVPKPRMTQSDKWRSRPCTARYWEYKDRLLNLWGDSSIPESIQILFVMPMPCGWSEKRKILFDDKPHQTKPDIDNLGKAFLDALLSDDSCIHDIRLTKRWGRIGCIYVSDMQSDN